MKSFFALLFSAYCLLLTRLRNEFRQLFFYCPILFHISVFIPLMPPCLSSFDFLFFSSSNTLYPPPVKFPSTSRILQNVVFCLQMLVPFPPKISSTHTHILLFPTVLYYFFPSLHTHACFSDSNFTVIYGNPPSKPFSQRQIPSPFPFHPPAQPLQFLYSSSHFLSS